MATESRQKEKLAQAPNGSRGMSPRAVTILTRLVALAVFLGGWEAVYRLHLVNPLFTSAPSQIFLAAQTVFTNGTIGNDIALSGMEFLLGYVGAIIIAVPLGLAAGWYPRLYYVLSPFVDVLNAVPRVTFLPIIIIWLGIGMWSKVALVFLGAVITIMINTIAGVKTHDVRFLRMAQSFGASDFKIFRTIVLPGTVPYIFTGLKYGAGQALVNMVVGELYGATAGIGYFISVTGNSFQVDQMFVGIAIVTVSGLVIVGILDRLERHFERWRPKVGA